MDKINQNNIKNASFKGIKPKTGEVKTMEEKVKKVIKDLLARAEREVPEYGDFKIVYEEFPNLQKEFCASDFMIKISQPPRGIENREKKRVLELVAYKLPSPYKASKILETGTKEDILKKLREDNLDAEVKKLFADLSQALEEI